MQMVEGLRQVQTYNPNSHSSCGRLVQKGMFVVSRWGCLLLTSGFQFFFLDDSHLLGTCGFDGMDLLGTCGFEPRNDQGWMLARWVLELGLFIRHDDRCTFQRSMNGMRVQP